LSPGGKYSCRSSAGRHPGPAGPPAPARSDHPGERGVTKFCTLTGRTLLAEFLELAIAVVGGMNKLVRPGGQVLDAEGDPGMMPVGTQVPGGRAVQRLDRQAPLPGDLDERKPLHPPGSLGVGRREGLAVCLLVPENGSALEAVDDGLLLPGLVVL